MITVVGIGAGGWPDLAEEARAALRAAAVVVGSARQLALLPSEEVDPARRERLASPLAEHLDQLLARPELCLLASGDPMLHGIGASLARRVPAGQLRVIPAVSSVSLAAARLGWPLAETTVRSLLTADPASLALDLAPGRRLLVLARDKTTAGRIGEALHARGWGPSPAAVLEQLGGPDERILHTTAEGLRETVTGDLAIVALTCRPAAGTPPLSRLAGLADDVYATDGALTRREVRAVVLAALAPQPGEVLWDVGSGSGSVAVEWLRAAEGTRAVAVEPRPERAERIAGNAAQLGVPHLQVRTAAAPAALAGLPAPQAVFLGGGLTTAGVLDAAWAALGPGGRLVATAVTVESEAVLHSAQRRFGGRLTRLSVCHAGALGGFTAWRPELPVVVWEVVAGAGVAGSTA